MFRRAMLSTVAVVAAAGLGAAAPIETRVVVTLAASLTGHVSGRLLIFVKAKARPDGDASNVDLGPDGVSVAARDVADLDAGRAFVIDTAKLAYPASFATLPPGDYRVQAVLDRNGDYNYRGRGPGDWVSKVVTVRFPLSSSPTVPLDHEVPPEPGQFDVGGLPPIAAEQILSSRSHLHDERIPSRLLARFHGRLQSVSAWVLTPPGYDPRGSATYPTVFTAGGFGATHKLDGQHLSRQWHLMETGEIPPMIWVALDFSTQTGTTEFADSASNGPWGQALVQEVIPTLEARYRMDAVPSGRFLTGHSSGGWFALWTMVRHPEMFGGGWATSPDPVDFHDFVGVDLYARGANMYRDPGGATRPFQRDHGLVSMTVRQAAKLEAVSGHEGGQLRSFEWVFSPRRKDRSPAYLFDRETGAIEPSVAAYWRSHYDLARILRTSSPSLRKQLDGKVHIVVGSEDSYYLDGAVRRLDATFRAVGARGDFRYVPGASHKMSEVYAREGDRNALWKQITGEMYAIARPVSPAVPRMPKASDATVHQH